MEVLWSWYQIDAGVPHRQYLCSLYLRSGLPTVCCNANGHKFCFFISWLTCVFFLRQNLFKHFYLIWGNFLLWPSIQLFRYIDNVFAIINIQSYRYVDSICPSKVIYKTWQSSKMPSVSFDVLLNIDVINGMVTSSWTSYIIIRRNIPLSSVDSVYVSQLIQFAIGCSANEQILNRDRLLINNSLLQGFQQSQQKTCFCKFYCR